MGFSGVLIWELGLVVCLILPTTCEAKEEGIPCIPKLTDMYIECGELVICETDVRNVFRVSGNVGDVFVVQASGPGILCIRLFAPDFTLIGRVCSAFGARIDARLQQKGTHAIEVFANQLLPYALALERVAPPCPSATPIDFGDLIEDEINPVGDLDLFFFEATAGDVITVQAARQSGPGTLCIELFGPDGTGIGARVCSPSGARIDARLEQTATYAILISEQFNDQTVGYALALDKCLPINCGYRIEEEINSAGDSDLFCFEATEGCHITVQATRQSGLGTLCIELFAPDGTRIGVACGFPIVRFEARLPQTGTYTIRVSANDSVRYVLALECKAESCAPSLRTSALSFPE